MYTLSQFRRGLKSPNLILREANRRIFDTTHGKEYNNKGVNILQEDWDNFVILDACRYDMFEEFSNLPGELDARISRGSATIEFLQANLSGRKLHDTVYITANPQLYRHSDSINVEFHQVENIWMEQGWDNEYGTVRPETITDRAIQASKQYPNKRLLIHYIQPHYPFLTEETKFDKGYIEKEQNGDGDFWQRKMTGKIDVEKKEIWDAYTDNLKKTLPYIKDLLQEVDGKTIVSSDHGNMVGEKASPIPIREWGHPRGIYTDQLVRVPWHTYDDGQRREIISEQQDAKTNEVSDTVVADRLRDLGYTE